MSAAQSNAHMQAAISALVQEEKRRAEAAGGGAGKADDKKAAMEEEPNQTLEQQETMKISGSNARHMVMQKLMRQSQVYGILW